ncbi:hypothetical protein F9278_15810 [Streptomyces phaeolivaceus]|uniref:Uncharacterized protein n=1 Tax=Streptomyces phaeolivaceus TaxID=2653200 RepID=A0A5P8K315_9ACTN|nr:hypothetical protein [Streptomyces phaeolivaceus]QFQ97434.1 hypothetical protein F9278_15810 [Streptomyces phaeolivaceus]
MAARTRGGADSRCPACRAPVITQLVGQRAALNVTADLTPLTPAQQTELREPNRLIWCLLTNSLGQHRLTWATGHPPDCARGDHVTEHRCPPAEPTTLF